MTTTIDHETQTWQDLYAAARQARADGALDGVRMREALALFAQARDYAEARATYGFGGNSWGTRAGICRELIAAIARGR